MGKSADAKHRHTMAVLRDLLSSHEADTVLPIPLATSSAPLAARSEARVMKSADNHLMVRGDEAAALEVEEEYAAEELHVESDGDDGLDDGKDAAAEDLQEPGGVINIFAAASARFLPEDELSPAESGVLEPRDLRDTLDAANHDTSEDVLESSSGQPRRAFDSQQSAPVVATGDPSRIRIGLSSGGAPGRALGGPGQTSSTLTGRTANEPWYGKPR